MPNVAPIQNSFLGGEWSPTMFGAVDNPRYKAGCEKLLGFIPALQGGAFRCPGTKFVAEVKTSSKSTRLISFEFSTLQAYQIEFGDQYLRFYRNYGQILDGGSPYEISSPYLEAELFQIKVTQSADVLYIFHPNHYPRKLTRTGNTAWTITEADFQDGPYLPDNDTDFTLTPSATSGSSVTLSSGATKTITDAANNGSGLIRITATAHGYETGDQVGIDSVVGTTEANGSWTITKIDADNFDLQSSAFVNTYSSGGLVYPKVFETTDTGRWVRLRHSSTWGWGKVTAVTHYGKATIDVVSNFGATSATTFWRLGSWSSSLGYPADGVFHEDRLCMTSSSGAPQRIDFSNTSDYENMSTTAADTTVTASNGFFVAANAGAVNSIRWIASDEKGLLAGTIGGEWVARGSTNSEALSPTNKTFKQSTRYGSADIKPVQVGKATLFVQRSTRKLREFNFFFEVDGFRSEDLNIIAEHITQEGLVEIEYMKEPQSIVWGVLNDGTLVGVNYDRDLENVRAGWFRRIIGGSSDGGATQAKVESISVIPSPDGTRFDLWMIVNRQINGSTKRYVEYLTKIFDEQDDQEDAFFVDSGLTLDDGKAITAITKTSPGVVTSASHGFSDNDRVFLRDIVGMTELNNQIAVVTNSTTNTFELYDSQGNEIDTSGYTTYVSGGKANKLVTTISGLDHLEGETVEIFGDGASQPTKTVSSGSITLSQEASIVHVGLPFRSELKPLRPEAGSATGTALGKTRRTHRMGLLLHRTLGVQWRMDSQNFTPIIFREASDKLDRAVPLYSGVISETIEDDYSFESQLEIKVDGPFPCHVLAIMPQMKTEDRT